MNHALVLSVFSSLFLVLTTLSGTTGDPGTQSAANVAEDDGSLPQVHGHGYGVDSGAADREKGYWFPVFAEKRGWKDLHTGAWGKRGWKDLHGTGWGKRFWGDLHNGWGKRDYEDLENMEDKRAWDDLKGGAWGKRFAYPVATFPAYPNVILVHPYLHPSSYNMGQLIAMPYLHRGGDSRGESDLRNLIDNENDDDLDLQVNEKMRNQMLTDAMSKRDWDSFRGSWGKRDPAWQNFQGAWGKRRNDGESKWARLKGSWGRR